MSLINNWSAESIKHLRLRLGYSRSDLSRRLAVSLAEVISWEGGNLIPPPAVSRLLDVLLRHCDESTSELCLLPRADIIMDNSKLTQLEREDFI